MSQIRHSTKKMKFSIKDFFTKCGQIRSFLSIWSHLLKKSIMENFHFYAACLWVAYALLLQRPFSRNTYGRQVDSNWGLLCICFYPLAIRLQYLQIETLKICLLVHLFSNVTHCKVIVSAENNRQAKIRTHILWCQRVLLVFFENYFNYLSMYTPKLPSEAAVQSCSM